MRRIVAKVLTGCGLIVRAAGDGVEALNAFRASREEPELVCADIRMPNMDGKEFARRLRQEGVDVPIIFVSGTIAKDQEGYREKSHVYLVSKPFSPTQLAEIIKEMLAKPRPKLGPRREAQPVKSPAELPPLPSVQEAQAPTAGFNADDFPAKTKPASIRVPPAPDRPFGKSAPSSSPEAPPAGPQPKQAGTQAKRSPAKPPPQPAPAAPAGPAAPRNAAAKPPSAPAPVGQMAARLQAIPGSDPQPVPVGAPQAPAGPPPRKRTHETTVIFLKPVSAVELPPAGPSPLRPQPPAAPLAAPPVATDRPDAIGHSINVERRIRESDRPELRKPGDWVPRLIIWPESAAPEAARTWCEAVAAALVTVQMAGGLEAYAFAPSAAPDLAGRRWRVRSGVSLDGGLFEAVLSRKLRAVLLLAPKGLEPHTFEFYLPAEHLDRSNVLTVGAVLADLNCTGDKPVVEATFAKEEAAFLRALHETCGQHGCTMRRSEWTREAEPS
jgi:CheY-like chemotaxis protein